MLALVWWCRGDVRRQAAAFAVLAPLLHPCINWAHYLTSLIQVCCQCLGASLSWKCDVRSYFDHEALHGLPWKSSSGTVHELLRRQISCGRGGGDLHTHVFPFTTCPVNFWRSGLQSWCPIFSPGLMYSRQSLNMKCMHECLLAYQGHVGQEVGSNGFSLISDALLCALSILILMLESFLLFVLFYY